MRFSVTLPDDIAQKVVANADRLCLTPTHYVGLCLTKELSGDDYDPNNFVAVARNIRANIEYLVENAHDGYSFMLHELPAVREACDHTTMDHAIFKTHVGKDFAMAVKTGKLNGVERAFNERGEPAVFNCAAIYQISKN